MSASIIRFNFCFILLILNSLYVFGQNNFHFEQDLDNQLSNAKKMAVGNPQLGLKKLDIVILNAKKKNNPYYEMLAKYNKVFFYADINDYKNVLKSSDQTIELAKILKTYDREIEATVKKSWALMHLGLLKETEKLLIEAQPLLDKLNTESDYHLAIIGNYWNTYHEFYSVQEKDQEAIKKGIKALEFYTKIKDSEDRNRRLIQSYSGLGSSYLFQNKSDSALYYFNTAQNLFLYNKFADKKSQAIIYSGSGIAYNMQKKYEKALPLLFKGLELSKDNYPDIYSETLNQISVNFKNTKNSKASQYYKKFIAIKGEYEKKNSLTAEEIQKIKETNNPSFFKNSKAKFLIIILLTVLISAIFIILKYKRNLKKSKEISQTNKATEITELLTLAKKNDPAFIKRFEEIYPDYYYKIVTMFPDLTPTHIKILLYSYLNYTTKDIALFMNITVRTVQTHKYRIRKIINISSDKNLIEWTKTI